MTAVARRPLLRIALAAAIIIVAAGVVAGYGAIQRFSGLCNVDNWEKEAFDSAAWKAAAREERYRYVRDILDKDMFVGADEARLYAALGEPGFVDPAASYTIYHVRSFTEGGCAFKAVAILHFDIDGVGTITAQRIRFD